MSKLQNKINSLRKELSDFDKSVQHIIDAQQEGLMWSVEMARKIVGQADNDCVMGKIIILSRLQEIEQILSKEQIDNDVVEKVISAMLGNILGD